MELEKLSLLFVEDDKAVQEVMLSFLEFLPFKNIYTASNGQEGLEKFEKYKPDLLITDLRMPMMSGLELSKRVKAIDKDVPIILITAQFEKEVTEEAVDIGVDAYLFKPISIDRFEKLVLKYAQIVLEKHAFLSEHKLLEEYKSAIDVSAAVTKTDANGVITYVNEAFCALTGYSKEELIGKRHNIIKHPQTPPSSHVTMWNRIVSKKVWKGKLKNRKKDGSTYFENLVIVPIVNDREEIVEFIAIRQDITDLYNQEQYLKKRIEEEVKQNLLETKYSTIGRMAAGITHEINTPLTYIKGNLELMLQDIQSLDDGVKSKGYLLEDVKIVLDGTNRIASIVESMREMASQSKELAEPNNVYKSLLTALTLAYNKSKQVTKIRIQNQLFSIGMDGEKLNYQAMIQRQRIEQVWVIIINNAVDALKHIDLYEERLLEIGIENEGDFIVVRFQDTGGGIDTKILHKVFDPFESTKEEGGIGIGLNVAKRIVDDHGGKIVASNYEKGALFEVYLPKFLQKD